MEGRSRKESWEHTKSLLWPTYKVTKQHSIIINVITLYCMIGWSQVSLLIWPIAQVSVTCAHAHALITSFFAIVT